MSKPIRILQVLLFREAENSDALGLPLWAALQEVEALYNHDHKRAEFQRYYLADPKSIPRRVWQEVTQDWGHIESTLHDESVWRNARGKFRRTYDPEELAKLARTLLNQSGKKEPMVLLTDLELTPPRDWRYILWSWRPQQVASVVSVAPMDPVYWGLNDPRRLMTIKHRARTACCSRVGEFLGLQRCTNSRCFLYRPIDSVLDLDAIRCLGDEHDLPDLAGLGFTPYVNDPITVQLLARCEPPDREEGSDA